MCFVCNKANCANPDALTTVKSVLSGHLKIDKTKVIMENDSLMEVESIAECYPWSNLQYF